MTIKAILPVYFIAGTQDIVTGSLPEVLETALKAGITCFQYREKGATSLNTPEARKSMAQACQQLCQKYSVPFIINDDVELAIEIAADGIHVGQEDQSIQEVLALFPDKIVGLSCYSEPEVVVANQLKGLSYYGIGPVYGTMSKNDAQQPLGLAKLKKRTMLAEKPVVAIGGINLLNAPEVLKTGVDGVSVITAITRAPRIDLAVRELKLEGNK